MFLAPVRATCRGNKSDDDDDTDAPLVRMTERAGVWQHPCLHPSLFNSLFFLIHYTYATTTPTLFHPPTTTATHIRNAQAHEIIRYSSSLSNIWRTQSAKWFETLHFRVVWFQEICEISGKTRKTMSSWTKNKKQNKKKKKEQIDQYVEIPDILGYTTHSHTDTHMHRIRIFAFCCACVCAWVCALGYVRVFENAYIDMSI